MPHHTPSRQIRKSRNAFPIALALLCILMAGLFFLYQSFGPQATAGTKHLTIDVVYEDSSMDTYPVTTDAEYLEEYSGGRGKGEDRHPHPEGQL